jgi:hypothetical protein
MPLKVITTRYKNKNIRAENTWFFGAKLFVDDVCVDKTKQLFSISDNKPLLEHKLTVDGHELDIEVYCVAWLVVKLKICANGIRVSGDDF